MAIENIDNCKKISSAFTVDPIKRRAGTVVPLFKQQGTQKGKSGYEFIDVSLLRSAQPARTKLQRKPSFHARSDAITLKKYECFDYKVLSVNEKPMEEDECHDDSDIGKASRKASKSPVESLGLTKRRFTLCVDSEQKDLESRGFLPPFIKTNSRYCDREVCMNNTHVQKHFCDIFGPGMCSDCDKARKQQANNDDFDQSFPDISVSPYMLCVPSDDDHSMSKTQSQVYKDCDMFRKRSMSRLTCYDVLPISPTRPNSSSLSGPWPFRSTSSSPLPRTSPTNFTRRRQNTASSISSVSSSRRSSIAQYIDSKHDELKHLGTFSESESGNESQDENETRRVKSVIVTKLSKYKSSKRTIESQSADLHQNVFHKAISPRTSGKSSRKATAIERRGKLSELPYWKFLIPEPPGNACRQNGSCC